MDGQQEVQQVVHRGRVFRLPFADLFQPLTPGEEAELRHSIGEIGVGHPVIVYDSPGWGPDCVIDGANRLRLAAEIDVGVTVDKVRLHDEGAHQMALDLNIVRRQVNPEEAREARARRIEKVAELRAQGKSTRAIAGEVGVSQPQVIADLRAAGDKGLSPEPEQVTGTDGKTYPATKPTPPDVDEWDSWEPEEPAGVTPVTPEPAATPPAPRRPVPPPGPTIDPDHPHAALLQAIVTLAGRISTAVNESESESKLRTYLLNVGFVYPRAKIVGDRHYGWQCCGLRGLYKVVRLAGLPGKPKPKDKILKEFAEAMRPEGET